MVEQIEQEFVQPVLLKIVAEGARDPDPAAIGEVELFSPSSCECNATKSAQGTGTRAKQATT